MGETITGIESVHPQSYAISLAEFTTIHPAQVGSYKPGDKVTRENFVPFLSDTFSKSRGVPEVQRGYFEWYRTNRSFDWETTLKNLRAGGVANCLSQEEVSFFLKKYTAIGRHTGDVYDEIKDSPNPTKAVSPEFITDLLGTDIYDKLYGVQKTNGSFIPDSQLKDMPWERFLSEANTYIKAHR